MYTHTHRNTCMDFWSEGLGRQISRFNTGNLWELRILRLLVCFIYFQHFIDALFEYNYSNFHCRK